MTTAYLRKCPKLPGAMRFQATYELVEVVQVEERPTEYVYQERRDVPQPGGGFQSEYGPPERRTKMVKWAQIRVRGRLKWVEWFGNLFERPGA